MEAYFFSKPLSQSQCRDNKKSCHLLEKKGTNSMRMHDNNTTCNRSNQIVSLPDTHSCSTNQHPAAPDTTKPYVTEAQHNAEKHSLFVIIVLSSQGNQGKTRVFQIKIRENISNQGKFQTVGR